MNNNYLIYGLDEYLINKEIDKIIKKNNIDKNSIIKYSLNEDSIDNILEDANTFNLFSDTKLIIVNDSNIFTSSNEVDTDKIINYITSKFVPSKKNRKVCRDYNRTVYKKRNQIERFLNRLKQFRRISTRYDKLEASFLPHTDAA